MPRIVCATTTRCQELDIFASEKSSFSTDIDTAISVARVAGHVLHMLSSSSDIKAAVEKIKAAPESGVTEVKAIIEMYAQLQVHQAAWQKTGEPLMHIEEAMSRFQGQHSIQEAAVPCLRI